MPNENTNTKTNPPSVNGCHFERQGEYADGLSRYVVVNDSTPEAKTERAAIRARAEKPSCFVPYGHPLKHEVVAELDRIGRRCGMTEAELENFLGSSVTISIHRAEDN